MDFKEVVDQLDAWAVCDTYGTITYVEKARCGRMAEFLKDHWDVFCEVRYQCNAFEKTCDQLRAEVERLKAHQLPEGVEWPRFEDGTPVRFGDEVDSANLPGYKTMTVKKLTVKKVTICEDGEVRLSDGMWCVSYKPGQAVPRPEPEDSWEKLEADACKPSCLYWGENYADQSCGNCIHSRLRNGGKRCSEQMMHDVMLRAKKLAGVS